MNHDHVNGPLRNWRVSIYTDVCRGVLCLYVVREISLYGACSYGDVCLDDNAECLTNSCQCVAGYTDRYARCGNKAIISNNKYVIL